MRPMFVAWLMLALLLLALGRLTHAGDQIEVAAYVTATDQDAVDGYFALGKDAMLVVQPGSGLHGWLRGHTGQRVKLVLANAAETTASAGNR